jgi:hypothetical protein
MILNKKDWIGNKHSTFVTLGASSHSKNEREINDFYATEPKAIKLLFDEEDFRGKPIWEPACGAGHLSKEIEKYEKCISQDLINRGYGQSGVDFLKQEVMWDGHIITNPPYKYAQEFVEQAISLIQSGNKVAMFLRLQFLEGKKRKKLFLKFPPKKVFVASGRLRCCINGDFSNQNGSAAAYAWFVWEKGYTGETIIKWIN